MDSFQQTVDQYQAFISSRENELRSLRTIAHRPCLQNGIDPFVFEWEGMVTAEHIVSYLEKRIKESHLFIGIYGREYGDRSIARPGESGLISPIELELKLALEHIGEEGVLLFVRDQEPEQDLRNMIGNRVFKRFQTDNEFALVLDESVKRWLSIQESRRRSIVTDERMMNITTDSPDRPGILAAVYRALFHQGGNIIRAKQTTHLKRADAKFLVQWPQGGNIPDEDAVKLAVEKELTNLYGDGLSKIKVRKIRSRESEVKTRGRFVINFYDGPGIAERIFKVFADENIGIVESNLRQLSKSTPPIIARFEILANVTNIAKDKSNILAGRLRKLAGIFNVRESVEMGSWWY